MEHEEITIYCSQESEQSDDDSQKCGKCKNNGDD